MATRCCSPPDSWAGLWSRRAVRFISASSSAARRSTSARGRLPMRPGRQMFSKAVNSGSRWWNWNTKPIRSLRKRDSSLSFSAKRSWPPISTRPASGRASEPMICSSVVFPAPLAPTIETTSPCVTSSDTPRSTSSVPKRLRMSVTFIIRIGIFVGGVLFRGPPEIRRLRPAAAPLFAVPFEDVEDLHRVGRLLYVVHAQDRGPLAQRLPAECDRAGQRFVGRRAERLVYHRFA